MKVVQINTVCGAGSTGKICAGISSVLNKYDIKNYIIYCEGNSDYKQAVKCRENNIKLQALQSRIKGNYGFNSRKTTQMIIEQLDNIKPDIVHLHNLHGHNCHLKMLTDYLRDNNVKVVWTFHDCWAFTAYCTHFVMAECDKWKDTCHNCIQYKKYSWFTDKSKKLFECKRNAIKGLELTVVTPSIWLADLAKQSFFKSFPVKVINNGIDTSLFKKSSFDIKKKYNIPENKFLILGVAMSWSRGKGPDVFARLAKALDSEKYQIVMVGTDEGLEQDLPSEIICIRRTADQTELAQLYSAADLFVNPTREENFPTVNLESLACGTPVLTYNTGGSPECIDEKTGMVVDCDDEEALYNAILYIEKERPFSSDDCIKRAENFDNSKKYEEYISLYRELMK